MNSRLLSSASLFALLFLPALLGHPAHADVLDDLDEYHALSVSGGLVHPSGTGALFENPAGLIYNHRFKLWAAGSSNNNSFNPLGLSGEMLFGNGFVGGGLGAQTSTQAGTTTLLNFGVAAVWESANIALGLAGTYVAFNSGAPVWTGPAASWGLNLGVIYNPRGAVRLGLSALQVLDNIDDWGAGIASDINDWATLAVDLSTLRNFQGGTLKPGLEIHLRQFQLTGSYGVALDTAQGSALPRGLTLGLGIRFNDNLSFEGYYNGPSLYYAGLKISM